MTIRDRILGTARGYQAWKAVTGGGSTMQRIVDQYLRVGSGDRVLDVGCGYGDMSEHLDGADYVGLDLNAAYIHLARKLHAGHAEFVVGSVTELVDADIGRFDVAAAVGVLHHLSDDDATTMLKALPEVLNPGGRFVAAEPVFHPEQRSTARVLAALDRGRYVRDQRGYESLVSPWLPNVSTEVRHDLYWFPYSHCIIQSSLAG